MERITIISKTTKTDGTIRLRFRLRDGRSVDLSHKSDIKADLRQLDKFKSDGRLKERITIYNKELLNDITREIDVMRQAYKILKDKTDTITSDAFEKVIDSIKHPEKVETTSRNVYERFLMYTDEQFRSGTFGEGRKRHYDVLGRELHRFMEINGMRNLNPVDFDSNVLESFRDFLFDEYKYVKRWEHLYSDMRKGCIPEERRSSNTVATKLKNFRAFFNALEDLGEIRKSPFRTMTDGARKKLTHEQYDTPVYLKSDEFKKVMETDVPSSLQETKDVFLLQCALGCRIGDFQSLTMENVSIENGIPYVHYLPKKTQHTQTDNSEVKTPLMLFAVDIIKKYNFRFGILKYVSGKSGYNSKIKNLLKVCEIDRRCEVYDESRGMNIYIPLHELGSSKLCRKTHVDMVSKVQINLYASGLHREGSTAVQRYTALDLEDKFRLMCAAFGQPIFKVDKNLKSVNPEKESTDSDLEKMVENLTKEQREQLIKLLEK